jgi:hypothetical protein
MTTESSFPIFADQGGGVTHFFSIDGSAVTTSQSSAGLDGRGSMLATIADSSNVQTVLFKRPMINCYIYLTPFTANGAATIAKTVNSAGLVTGFTLTGVERDDNTTPLADQDWDVFVMEYTTTQYVQ